MHDAYGEVSIKSFQTRTLRNNFFKVVYISKYFLTLRREWNEWLQKTTHVVLSCPTDV